MQAFGPQAGSSRATSVELPAPVGGWNARDPLSMMKPTDAVYLDNFFPRAGDVIVRPGRSLWATLPADDYPGNPHAVQSMMSYSAPDGSKKLFAACEDGIYDITAGGTFTTPDSAATDPNWLSVNVTTAGGSFLWCCNGVDKSRIFNGSAWTELDGVSVPALTGITSTDITNVSLFKTRLMLCKKDSLSFYYLSVNSIAGAAVEFPLGSLFSDGGYLMATGAWTLDGGNGPSDYFVAVTSEGQIAVYSGIDPSSANTWALVGVYKTARPMSRQCLVKIGGDLCVLTTSGTIPLSQLLVRDRMPAAVSDKISRAWNAVAKVYGDLPGWQAVYFPVGPLLLVNVPVLNNRTYRAGVVSYQFVMNTITKAWCRFVGQSAQCWVVHDGKLYCGLRNEVYEAWTGSLDGEFPIDCRGKQAFFQPFSGRTAHVKLVAPVIRQASNVQLQFGIDVDFAEGFTLGGTETDYLQTLGIWDQSNWNQAYWSSGSLVKSSWKGVSHWPADYIAPRLRALSSGGNMEWIQTRMIIQPGSIM